MTMEATEKRTLILVTGSEETKQTLMEQLEDSIGELVTIRAFAVEENVIPELYNETVLLSSELVVEEVSGFLHDCQVIVASRIVNFHFVDQLIELRAGTEVLYVNDYPETVNEAIESLQQVGLDHLKYYPFYPGKKMMKRVAIAVTPGEVELVPDFVERVINVGPRLLDISTVLEVCEVLQLPSYMTKRISNRFILRIIELSRRIASVTQEATQLSRHLMQVVDGVHDGILAVDTSETITVFNGILETLLSVRGKRMVGRHVSDVIMNESLRTFLLSEETEAYMTIEKKELMVHAFTVDADGTKVVTIKNAGEALEMEKKRKRELMKKGYIAKYTLQDIVGRNERLEETKRIAQKLAKSDLTILIEGESGTGKELFASSIHRESPRRNGPFLAVNFSALPEDLVESELFGYEEGAFTGARKGGRIGLFEQANGGTIFLDEIGDVSVKVQARLLRVLQEKELLRIGGDEIIPVDVRVIAATNRNLLDMIEDGAFREDLYHRLKVLFLHLPPLRQRKDDIDQLVRYFIHQAEQSQVRVHPFVFEQLRSYDWFGNVRELKNTIDYMLTVCDGDEIHMKDIPNESFFQQRSRLSLVEEVSAEPEAMLTIPEEELRNVLELVLELSVKQESISRKKVMELARVRNLALTEQQVRYRLEILQERGYVYIQRGRMGTRITEAGKAYLNSVI
ncbi:sigma 54-interacting transcriptional regulator [Paenalkalicoccus suaedae]|uniref:Sigma 54-interacting transcriptional regulator n=1 Tax=Paenalkalicoccus suaedae TaxID=2592382 RepID=A0A859FA57_9BACI|nr:sigma 54-interacting transcriptional regulator [Paenalkalicoccus suaedae]QKS69770.1 sigma 54-interacting transcriptional regulator [Paenalkalicoccus suaedae]